MRSSRVLVVLVLAFVFTAASASAAPGWVKPFTSYTAGECNADGSRQPITWIVTNPETRFPGSPLYLDPPHLSIPFQVTVFAPQPVDGLDSATADMVVPPRWAGTIYIDYRGEYRGTDGRHVVTGFGEITLKGCQKIVGTPPCARVV